MSNTSGESARQVAPAIDPSLAELTEADLLLLLSGETARADALFQELMGLKNQFVQTLLRISAYENRIRALHGLPLENTTPDQVIFQMTAHQHSDLPTPRIFLN